MNYQSAAGFFSLVKTTFYICAGIFGISFLVGFHELGHFVFAKLSKIRTPSFSIGFGPALFQKKIGDTTFKFSAIPLGGYVEIAGMEEVGQGEQQEAGSRDQYSFATKPYYQKLLVLFGGILFNLLFAYGALILLFSMGLPKTALLYPLNATTTLELIEKDSPAEKAGLRKGDTLITFNNVDLNKQVPRLLELLEGACGKEVDLHFVRDGIEQTTHITLQAASSGAFRGRLGVQFAVEEIPSLGLGQAFFRGVTAANQLIYYTARSFGSLLKRRTTDGLGGPVMIISQITKSAQHGFKTWLMLLILLSISLAILNLIPLPILDGGQILFYTIEAVIRRPLPTNIRLIIHYASWLLILLFTLYISVKDIKALLGFK